MRAAVVVIGGAGRVGRGVCAAFRAAGQRVLVVDPAAGPGPDCFALRADEAGLAARLRAEAEAGIVVISLPARGQGRPAGSFRPAQVAACEWAPRLAAQTLAVQLLDDGGVLVELAGGAALAPGDDEAGLVAGLQRGVHRGLAGVAGLRTFLCAIDTHVGEAPAQLTAAAVGAQVVALAGSTRRGGLCRISGGGLEWPQPQL